MSEWNPNEEFLEFLESALKYEDSLDIDTQLFESNENMIESMRTGTPEGRTLYSRLYSIRFVQQKFQEWKKTK